MGTSGTGKEAGEYGVAGTKEKGFENKKDLHCLIPRTHEKQT